MFGGYNSAQVFGGKSGLKTFKVYPTRLGTWALKPEGVFYQGTAAMQNRKTDPFYPAIIDTGSSQVSIPSLIFDKLSKKWKKAVSNIECHHT